MEWDNVSFGDYTLTARATDSDGASSDSDPVIIYVKNEKPTVSILGPSNDALFIEFNNITIEAEAKDRDGSINRVDFYADDKLLGSDNSKPHNHTYSYIWKNVPRGLHNIKVKAVDNNDEETWSSIRSIVVIETPDDDSMWYGRMLKRISTPYERGKWFSETVKDNVDDSGNQWIFFDDKTLNKTLCMHDDYSYVEVHSSFTTYYWVPRDITVYNYARNDDDFYIYLNGEQVFFNTYSHNDSTALS